MNRVRLLSAAFAAAALVWAGCNGGGKPDAGQDSQPLYAEWKVLRDTAAKQPLAGTLWILESIKEPSKSINDMGMPRPNLAEGYFDGDHSCTIEFKEDGTFETKTSVNTFCGTYAVGSRGDGKFYIINVADFRGKEAGDGIDGRGDRLWRELFPTIDRIVFAPHILIFYCVDENNTLGVPRKSIIFRPLNESGVWPSVDVWSN